MYRIKSFFERIHNLYRWFPIIWKDQDWDYHYILETLKFKLSNQSKYTLNKSKQVNASKDARMMDLCVRLISKIQDEYYLIEFLDYEVIKHEFKKIENTTELFQLKTETISENFDEYFKKYLRIYKSIDSKECKAGIAMKIGNINHNRAKKLLFKILENNIEKWWF